MSDTRTDMLYTSPPWEWLTRATSTLEDRIRLLRESPTEPNMARAEDAAFVLYEELRVILATIGLENLKGRTPSECVRGLLELADLKRRT